MAEVVELIGKYCDKHHSTYSINSWWTKLMAGDGTVMQRTDYDEFGLIIDEDLAENWTPVLFGYAGGLQDRDTGLIRFGARDYDPMVGRWTSKEPLGFNGRNGNQNNTQII